MDSERLETLCVLETVLEFLPPITQTAAASKRRQFGAQAAPERAILCWRWTHDTPWPNNVCTAPSSGRASWIRACGQCQTTASAANLPSTLGALQNVCISCTFQFSAKKPGHVSVSSDRTGLGERLAQDSPDDNETLISPNVSLVVRAYRSCGMNSCMICTAKCAVRANSLNGQATAVESSLANFLHLATNSTRPSDERVESSESSLSYPGLKCIGFQRSEMHCWTSKLHFQ